MYAYLQTFLKKSLLQFHNYLCFFNENKREILINRTYLLYWRRAYSDGSLGNITLEFPLFCNQELSTDAVDDQMTIRVVARIRNDIRTEGSSLNNFTVVVRSVGLLSDVTPSLGLIVKGMVSVRENLFLPTMHFWSVDFADKIRTF